MNTPNGSSVDALLPPEMARRAELVGARKATVDPRRTLALAALAGAFIGLGAAFSTTVTAGAAGVMPYGVTRLLAGVAFSLGLILVVVGGAELFTGNTLIVMALAAGDLRVSQVLRNWGLVYLGNAAGAVTTALLVFLAGQYRFGGGAVGRAMLDTAAAKTDLEVVQAIALGILCNGLVCLAVWLCMSARSTTDRILAIVFPISAFVAAGFEHSIANLYLIPVAMLVRTGAPDAFWAEIGSSADDYPTVTAGGLVSNLVPVTIGNVLGGAVLVGLVYWFVYLRGRGSAET